MTYLEFNLGFGDISFAATATDGSLHFSNLSLDGLLPAASAFGQDTS
jgi:hypothetical protein